MNPYFLVMLVSELLASTSQILLKKSAMKEHKDFFSEYLNRFVISGYLMLGISMLITIFAYKVLNYMQVIVLEPISYILVMFLSRLTFQEKITGRKCLGMLCIIAGIVVFNL